MSKKPILYHGIKIKDLKPVRTKDKASGPLIEGEKVALTGLGCYDGLSDTDYDSRLRALPSP
jgi:hypothetical protein